MTHDLSTSTAAEDLEHKDMDAALCQIPDGDWSR